MSLSNSFNSFVKDLCFDISDIETTCREITKKLNSLYYDLQGDSVSHFYYVGSIGRKTAVKNTSDVDIIFDMPRDVYDKYDSYETNGQSALLQDVKEVLKERYSKTQIRGDGQVVVIEFDKFTVELVPAFILQDKTFVYPDTHDGGSWRITDPFSEQKATAYGNDKSNGIFVDVCRMLRIWKNEIGVIFGGLLIDTLCYNLFDSNDFYQTYGYEDYYTILIDVFEYLKNLNKEQTYWFALGSNQKVYSKDNTFIRKAEKAYNSLSSASTTEEQLDILTELFGKRFPHESKRYSYSDPGNTEEYIEEKFPLDIRYNLSIDCTVSQNGFREFSLRKMLLQRIILRHNKQLTFSIEKCDVPKPYDIYWKVRNVGPIAKQKKMIRGQIVKTNKDTHNENTNFQGPHFVECYIVKNGVCVARDKIDVPIGSC